MKQNLYGGSSYQHQPSIEYFWEDCADENEVLKRDYMRLTLKQIQDFGLSFQILEGVIEDLVVVDPEYEKLSDKSHPKVDWSKNKVLNMNVRASLVLKRTQDWLEGKWRQAAGSTQKPKSSHRNE